MRVLTFKKRHHLTKLHDELLEAVSALRPVPGPDGEPQARLLLGGDGETIEMLVPDDLSPEDIAAIEQVVNTHDPTPPPPPPDPDQQLAEAIAKATTFEELKDALLGRYCKTATKARVVQR